jgi:hypothetical protein
MKKATPQRTVTISLSGRMVEDTEVTYSYWSPHDGASRTDTPVCDLYQSTATNTLFVLDYAASQNGWIITGTEPNPPGSPALEAIRGPAKTSIMTMFPDRAPGESYNFYIVYQNTLTDVTVRFDPQEENRPPM